MPARRKDFSKKSEDYIKGYWHGYHAGYKTGCNYNRVQVQEKIIQKLQTEIALLKINGYKTNHQSYRRREDQLHRRF